MSALVIPLSYEPKAVFSPSGLSRAQRCLYAWGLRYLLGIKEGALTWAEASALPVPVAKIKSRPTQAERDAKKAYNKAYRPALGHEVHARAECYYKGGSVEWNDKPGRILLAGMHYLPHPDECEVVEAEGEITIEIDGVAFRGYRDLLLRKDGVWLLVDYKTTFTFDFFDREKTLRTVKTPAQLQADPQANLYAYAVMRREGMTSLACRWLYLRTEGKPEGLPVDFVITWEGASAIVAELVALAKELTEHVGAALGGLIDVKALLETLEKNPDACEGFGGCEYRADRGGPCHPPELTPGEKLVRLRLKNKARAALPPKEPREKRTRTMGFRNKPAAAAPTAPVEEVEAPDEGTEEETVDGGTQPEGTFAADEAPAAPAPKTAAAPAPTAPKPPKKPAAKGVKAVEGGVFFEALGERVELPSTFPGYAALVRIAEAQQALNAAMAGDS